MRALIPGRYSNRLHTWIRAPFTKSKRSSFREFSLLLVLLALGTICLQSDVLQRILSSSSIYTYYQDCDISTISLPLQPIIPIFAASYPGSGAQMTHYLYEALTGLESGDEWLHRGDTYDRITIKTHYPARQHQVEGSRLMQRAILLIRSPLHSIPSYHNYLYEKEHDIPDHTTRSPVEAWLQWRDEHFEEELKIWKDHLTYWITQYDADDRLVISYERLVDNKMGPIESTRIANFLGRSEGIQVVPPSQIPCVWDKVVNYKRIELDEDGNEINDADIDERKLEQGKFKEHHTYRHLYDEHGNSLDKNNQGTQLIVKRRVKYVSPEDPAHPKQSHREGNQVYAFTKSQLEAMRTTLNALRGKFLSQYTLVVMLSGYIEEINEELHKLEED